MPFESKAQMKACFAKKSRGEGKGWNCEEWARATPNIKKLPEHVKKAALNSAESEIAPLFTKIANSIITKRKQV
jgi:hypothetical protein